MGIVIAAIVTFIICNRVHKYLIEEEHKNKARLQEIIGLSLRDLESHTKIMSKERKKYSKISIDEEDMKYERSLDYLDNLIKYDSIVKPEED